MKELQPLNQNVLLELPGKKEQVTTSGIIIPETVADKPNTAKVVAVGNIENSGVNVGDTVIYKVMSGEKVEFEGKNYLFIPYADLLAKIVETEEI